MNDNTQAQPALPDGYFGGCPKCGRWDEYLNVGRAHWHVCHKHRTKYWFGENLMSDWRTQSPEEWQENAATLAGFTEVRPAYPAVLPEVVTALQQMMAAVARTAPPFSDRQPAERLAEAVEVVRGWLDAERDRWIQYVDPDDDDEPVTEEGVRV